MRRILVSLLLLSQLPMLLVAQQQRSTGLERLAFTHVTVIDATGSPAKPDMTVIITGDRIAAVGKSKTVSVPTDARIVDASGKFLIPGLWDMHTHLGDEALDKGGYLLLFLANGVTGIRIMHGAPAHHLWRKEIEDGRLPGPRLIIASPIIDGPKMSEAEAREAVRKAKEEGADFIKVHDQIPRDAYFALVDEAKRLRLPVEGHVPKSITAAEASAAGQKSIEHLTGVALAASDSRKAKVLFATFRKNQTWQCPTLMMRHNHTVLDDSRLADDSRLKYVEPSWRKNWLDMQTRSRSFPADEWTRRRDTVRKEVELVGELQKAGVGILAGTDDGNYSPYIFPGFSLHEELAMLVEAGLTRMQALQTATLNPAKFLNMLDTFGTVEAGKFADLVLLDADPLEDIRNTEKINAVVKNGRVMDRKALDEMLFHVEAAMSKE